MKLLALNACQKQRAADSIKLSQSGSLLKQQLRVKENGGKEKKEEEEASSCMTNKLAGEKTERVRDTQHKAIK